MATFRKAKKSKFTSIPNVLAQDNSLSLKARGLMLYILSLPDNWVIRVNHLTKVMKEGRDSILSALKELKKSKYIYHIKLKFDEGWSYFVFEEPTSEEEFKLFLRTNGFSNNWETQQLGNPQLQKTNSITKKEVTKKEPPPTPPKKPEKKKPLKKGEEFFKKAKEEKEKEVERAKQTLRKEGCPENVIEKTIQELKERGLNAVKSIISWCRVCSYRLMQENATEAKYERFEEIALKLQEKCPNNFQVSKGKGVFYLNGNVQEFHPFSDEEFLLREAQKRL